MLTGILLQVAAQTAGAETPGEARFFKDCPRGAAFHLHDERNPWDLHAMLYTTLGLSEIEVLHMADWVIDLPIPGQRLRPLERGAELIRMGYNRLPSWWGVRRVGQLVSALQLPGLSLGDATATYTVATGGLAGPGSGMVIRIEKVIDWTQRLTGDLNRWSGWPAGRRDGLITWSLPSRAVDGMQALFLRTFHHVGVLAARTADAGLSGVELIGDGLAQLGHRRPHRETTVFLRVPIAAYRAHELWILEHRAHLVLGTAAEFARSTHAALAHRRRATLLRDWSELDRPDGEEPAIILMTTVSVVARAPASLHAYVVPAAWVLNPAPAPHQDQVTPEG